MYTALYTDRSQGRSAHAYATLKAELLRGEHRHGQRLAETRLATSLGVSRTPVREALSRLHAEGLVERHPSGGYSPSAPDLPTIRDLYEVRFELEVAALRRPGRRGERHDPAALESLEEDWSTLDPPDVDADGDWWVDPDFVLLDEDYHVRLAAAGGNRSLAELLERVNERIRLVRMLDFLGPERVGRTIEQHLAILGHLRAGRVDEAERCLLAHFDESHREVEERALAALGRMLIGERETRP